jgi:hypothetical protein
MNKKTAGLKSAAVFLCQDCAKTALRLHTERPLQSLAKSLPVHAKGYALNLTGKRHV